MVAWAMKKNVDLLQSCNKCIIKIYYFVGIESEKIASVDRF